MLVLSRQEVESLLDLDRLVDAVAQAMADLSAGRASMPPRVAAMVADRHAFLATMPSFLPSANVLLTKLVSVFPENRDRPTHQALICCFDPETGSPIALMDGTYVTATRTAAGSALATRMLSRADASEIAILGTGVQARAHAEVMVRVRAVKRLRVAGRDRARVQALVEELVAAGLPAQAAPSFEDAVRSADIVCAATHANEPVLQRAWLRPGTHVNSVGYNTSGRGEIDADTIRDALLFVESRAAVLAPPPSGAVELRLAIEQGVVAKEHIRAEIGELVAGRAGRTEPAQLTLYKSVGVAVQDAAAAAVVLRAAQEKNVGTEIRL